MRKPTKDYKLIELDVLLVALLRLLDKEIKHYKTIDLGGLLVDQLKLRNNGKKGSRLDETWERRRAGRTWGQLHRVDFNYQTEYEHASEKKMTKGSMSKVYGKLDAKNFEREPPGM